MRLRAIWAMLVLVGEEQDGVTRTTRTAIIVPGIQIKVLWMAICQLFTGPRVEGNPLIDLRLALGKYQSIE